MKVLIDHPNPFLLAHGGFQVQIEQTRAALERCGLEVEWLRWRDEHQRGDLVHYFGRPSALYVRLAHEKGIPIVISELFGGTGARPRWQRSLQSLLMGVARRVLPRDFTTRLAWDVFTAVDACVALTKWEAHLLTGMFSAPPEKVHVVPNGVEAAFLESAPVPRGRWLVCAATITAQKRVLELAHAAIKAAAPVWFIGRPYVESDPYAQRFVQTAREHAHLVRYEGVINDRAQLADAYREARGFVLLSQWESLSLSALEAAACGCPLLLGDLPWAHSVFGAAVSYCSVSADVDATARALRRFYDAAPTLAPPPRPASWLEVAQQVKAVYETVLSTSR